MSDIKNKVNTYLFAAQILASQTDENPQSGAHRAAVVGASSSLKLAWEAWLEELASYLKVSAGEIEDQSSEATMHLPDCQYLFGLKQELGSWYQQVSMLSLNPLYFYEREFAQVKRNESGPDEGRIGIVAVAAEEELENSLLGVINECKAYIQHTREQQTEW